MEAKLLHYLSVRAGHVVSVKELLANVWGYKGETRTKTVYTTVARLRAAIGDDPKAPTRLRTIPATGFLWVASESTAPTVARPAPEVDARLPGFAEPLFGRREVLQSFEGRVLEGARLLTLTGPPGVGKTRTAIALADRLASRLVGRVEFVDLRRASTDDQFVAHLSGALGIETRDEPALALALAARVGGLLLLDGAEQVRVPLSRLLSLALAQPAGPLVLVTSRAALRVRSERVWPLAPLQTAQDGATGPSEAATFFVGRAQLPTAPDPADVEAVVERLGGLPLALELAAARTRVVSVRMLRELLEKGGFMLRTKGTSGSPDRSLHEAIRPSWDALSPAARVALQRLCFFTGVVGTDLALAAVGAGSDIDALETIDELALHSLIELRADRTALWLLPPIRDHALLSPSAHRHVADAEAALAESLGALALRPPWARDAQDRPALERARPYLAALIRGSWERGDLALARRLLARWLELVRIRGHVDVDDDLTEAICASGEPAERAHLWLDAARVLMRVGGARAMLYTTRGIDDAITAGDVEAVHFGLSAWLRFGEANASPTDWSPPVPPALLGRPCPELQRWLWNQAAHVRIQRHRNDPDGLRAHIAAAALLPALPDTREAAAQATRTLALCLDTVGDRVRALSLASAALERMDATDPWALWAPMVNVVVWLRLRLGQLDGCAEKVVLSQQRAREAGRPDILDGCGRLLNLIYAEQGDYGQASEAFHAALDNAATHHRPLWMSHVLHEGGLVALKRGDPTTARRSFLEAQRASGIRSDDRSYLAIGLLLGLHQCALAEGHLDPTLTHPSVLAEDVQSGMPELAAVVYSTWAWVDAVGGDHELALLRLDEARRFLGDEHGPSRWSFERASLAIARLAHSAD